jgi:putative transposase
MGKPYSEDLRRGVVQGIEAGHSYEEVADLYCVSVSSVSRFVTRWRKTGSVAGEVWWIQRVCIGAVQGSHHAMGCCAAGHHAGRAAISIGETVSQTAIFRFLRHLGFTFKKKPARGRTRSC